MNLLKKARQVHTINNELVNSINALSRKLGITITYHNHWEDIRFTAYFQGHDFNQTSIYIRYSDIVKVKGYNDDEVEELYSRFRQVMFGVPNNES
jgi:hypothetical protein